MPHVCCWLFAWQYLTEHHKAHLPPWPAPTTGLTYRHDSTRHHRHARSGPASRRWILPPDMGRPRRPAPVRDLYLFLAQRRRGEPLAPRRCGRNLALLRRCSPDSQPIKDRRRSENRTGSGPRHCRRPAAARHCARTLVASGPNNRRLDAGRLLGQPRLFLRRL